ncbi:hypothetical protein [Lactococcus lactis]|uniref:hypothetical protein n=1 Tax=Lactococcus lactis TaxID=1358 RepID=UPI0023AA00D6|nr:hypothetical protein [Lactococcus lactis]WEA54426.1 hypothetical protein PWP91_09075 [Lactococcus lactis]
MLIEKRNKNEELYDDRDYPIIFKFPTALTNTGENINSIKRKTSKILDVLLKGSI